MKGNVLFESKLTYGIGLYSVCAEQVNNDIPRGWYDRDFKVVIRYSKELVSS